MMLALLFSTILQPEPLITTIGPTRRLDAVLRDVGEQAGVKITVQGAPENDYVFLHVNERPLKKVLDLIAQGTLSEWSEVEPGVYKVHGSPVVPDRVASIQKWLDDHPPLPPLTRASAVKFVDETLEILGMPVEESMAPVARAQDQKTPRAQAMAVLAHELGAERLAAIPEGESLRFRARPTGVIAAIPPKTLARLQQLPREVLALREVLIEKGFEKDRPPNYNYSTIFNELGNKGEPAENWDVAVTGYYDGVAISYREIGQNNPYGFASPSLHVTSMPSKAGDDRLFMELMKTQATFAWSPSMLEMLPSHAERQEAGGRYIDSPAVLNRLLKCAEEEVFTMGLDDALAALARDQKRDVFALVPDQTFQEILRFNKEQNLVREPLLKLFDEPRVEYVGQDALIIREDVQSPLFRLRFPRAEAQAAFRDAESRGHVTLDHYGDLAAASPHELLFVWASHQFLYRLQTFSETLNPSRSLEVYGCLTAAQRAAAKDGIAVGVGSMSAAQRGVVSRFLYHGAQLVSGSGRREMSPAALVGPADFNRSVLRVRVERTPALFRSEKPVTEGGLSLINNGNGATRSQREYEKLLFTSCPMNVVTVEVETAEGHVFRKDFRHCETPKQLEWVTYAELAAKLNLPLEPWKKQDSAPPPR